MLLAVGVGIKIFCFYLLYQPWNFTFANEEIKKNKEKLRYFVKCTGSIFYYILLEDFCLNIKEVHTLNK
jgi:hypothetical protein